MKYKHTPGLWILQIGKETCFHEGNRVSITQEDEALSPTIAEVWPTRDDSDIADGRLIVAAPEMLKEGHNLVMMCLQSERYRDDADFRDQVDDLIAVHRKAIGEEIQ